MVAMAPLWPKLLSFSVPFAVLAIFWVGHAYFFHWIKEATAGLLWLNIVLLFWLCLVPFPTQFIGAHPTAPFAIFLYSLDMLLASLDCCS
jgi:uncharacterized membrane protein